MNSIDATSALSSLSGPSATTASMSDSDKEKLKTAATQLEATFTGYLMEEFDKGLPGTSGTFASQIYSGMFKDAVATQVAESHAGQGLAQQIYNNTLKLASHQKAAEAKKT